jgi:predicted Zn-dependent protease
MASGGMFNPMAEGPAAGTAKRPSRERRGQVAFEIDFLERVLARSPEHVDALRRLAELLSRHGQVERALEIDRRLVALRPEDCIARYNLACTLARGNRSQEALAELRRAIESGYDDLAFLEVDRDLEALRGEPEYQALLTKLRRRVAESSKN